MKFCAACGAALHGGRFCPACGAAVAAPTSVAPATASFVPPAAPTAQLPPLRAAPRQFNWPAVVTGLLALMLVAGGATFLVMRDSGDTAQPSTTSSPPASTVADSTTLPATTLTVLDPAAQLAASRDADRPTVEALVGRWVPQLSAKREGVVADGLTYTLADIVALHGSLRTEYGALLVWSGEYVFDNGDLWVSVAPEGFATAQEALDWCVAKARDRDNCLARLITHDPAVGPTLQMQP
jgi:hypothetical protein